jgi:hypothetical protein
MAGAEGSACDSSGEAGEHGQWRCKLWDPFASWVLVHRKPRYKPEGGGWCLAIQRVLRPALVITKEEELHCRMDAVGVCPAVNQTVQKKG